MRVSLGFYIANPRHAILHQAVVEGMASLGWPVVHPIDSELHIMWGVAPENKRFLDEPKPVLVIDLPYWGRTNKNDSKIGYYKIALNGIHPTPHLDKGFGQAGRYHATGGPMIKPWQKGGQYILLAGMGPKGSELYGYQHGWWDAAVIKELQAATDYPIVYRAKPSDRQPPRMPEGVILDDSELPIAGQYSRAHAVVTHHGNSAIEALQHGVPIYCHDGPAKLLATKDISKISYPRYAEGREDLMEKLAWWQWSYNEICQGKPFLHLKERGLI